MAPTALSAAGPSATAATPPAGHQGPGGAPRGADDLAAVLAARSGDAAAFGELFARWADRVHDLALRIVRDRDAAADVTQEAFEVAWRRLPSLEQPLAFGGWLLRIARNRALDRLGRDGRTVPAGAALDDGGRGVGIDPVVDDVAPATVEAAEAGALLWAASAALAPRDASILDLHLRHGMAAGEIAAELDVSPAAAHQMLHRLRGRLREAVRATVLWQRGAPACALLRADLRQAGVTSLDAVAVSVIGDHADRCDPCAERRRARLAPEALFTLAPLLALPPAAHAAAVRALTGATPDAPATAVAVGPQATDPAPAPVTDGRDASTGRTGTRREVSTPDAAWPDPVPATAPIVAPVGPTGRERRGRPRRAVVAAVAAAVLLLATVAALLGSAGTGPGSDAAVVAAAAPAPSTVPVVPRSGDGAPAPELTPAPAVDSAPPGDLQPASDEEPAPPAESAPSAPSAGSSTPPTEPAADGGAPSEVPEGSDAPSPGGAAGTLGEGGGSPSAPPPVTPPAIPPESGAEAPEVLSLTATRSPRPGCATPSEAIVVVWRATGADAVSLSGPGAPGGGLPAFGSAVVCSPTAATYRLVASGAGGVTEAVVTVA